MYRLIVQIYFLGLHKNEVACSTYFNLYQKPIMNSVRLGVIKAVSCAHVNTARFIFTDLNANPGQDYSGSASESVGLNPSRSPTFNL